MKRNSIIIIFFILFTNLLFTQSNFDKGFKVGYKKGFCQDQGVGCIEPITPISPVPGINESYNSYTDGYNRGFTMAINKRNSKKTNSNSGNTSPKYERPAKKYNPTKSSINHNLIAQVLNQKQKAIDRERAYLQSLSYEERQALISQRQYSERKDYLYSKNLKRWRKVDKKIKKRDRKLAKEIKKNTKKYNKSRKIKLSNIKNGWHKTIVNIRVNYVNNYVKRLVFFENGIITKYVGGTGFLSNIYAQSKTQSYEITMKVGYEKNETTSITVSFLKNTPLTLKEEPVYPTLIKFFTTSNNGKMTIFVNGTNFSDYFTLHKSFRKGNNVTCEQVKGVITFYVGQGDFEFYAFNSSNQWSGKINTKNRYCILKELNE